MVNPRHIHDKRQDKSKLSFPLEEYPWFRIRRHIMGHPRLRDSSPKVNEKNSMNKIK